MKKVLILSSMVVISIFAFSIPLNSTTIQSASGDSIKSIRAHFATINKNIKNYRKVEKELSGYSAEGGALTAYFDGGSIRKIVGRFYGEMGRADEEYYFWDDRLIFVYRKESAYDRPLSGKVISTKTNRFYFNNTHMIRWINEMGQQIPASRSSFDEKQREYLKSAREFAELARS